jgi:hydroxyacylglutathione hydrolase
MILKRFYHTGLAQASYLAGCPASKEAIVIDANRDVDQYIQAAEAEGMTITAVSETHIHADYVSGSRELAERTGAKLYLSDEGDADWKYAFADQPNVTLIKDGDKIEVGPMVIEILHTPGHTPEHISFLLTDTSGSMTPMGAFTGDFVFVGDVGRPDLLERAANFEGTMEKGARVLHNSIQKFLDMPDHLLLWPAHGAGSACGKSLGGLPDSSLGYEKLVNWGLKVKGEDKFVDEVLSGQPEPPFYFKEMKRINKVGPPILGGMSAPAQYGSAEFLQKLEEGAVIVDVRNSDTGMQQPMKGVLNVPLGKGFCTFAGWTLPFDTPIWLIAETEAQAAEASKELKMIGLDDTKGWFGPSSVTTYVSEFGQFEPVKQVSMEEALAAQASGAANILDVRGLAEREDGAISGSTHIPYGWLSRRIDEVPKDKPLYVHCRSGGRSPVALSILKSNGIDNVVNIPGGWEEFESISAKTAKV